MAESVVKLRVDSQEYDAKIKRAAEGLRAFGENCQKAGESVSKADKETLDYVQAIGKMETVSRTVRGKINEMTTAFTELSVQYRQLTDDEKKSPFGQALSQSLDQLKNRINESKTQLTEVNSELGNTSEKSNEAGSVLGELAGKFGININQASAFGVALAATTAAAKVAKDAFFANEMQLDEWGRVVASSESVYHGFLDALNTGDISGFLSRISSIISAARDAYDALDELATFNAFNQVNVARTRQQLMDAQNDFREGTGSKEQVRTAAGAYKAELDQRRELEKNAYIKTIVKHAQKRGVNPADLARVMLGSYGDYNKLKSLPLTGTDTTIKTNMYGQQWKQTTRVAANEMERMGEMLRRFNDTELQELQGLGARYFQTGFEKGQIDRQVNRILNGRQGGAGGSTTTRGSRGGRGGGGSTVAPPPEGSIAAQEAEIARLTKLWREATTQVGRDGYVGQLEAAKKTLSEMQGKVDDFLTATPVFDMNRGSEQMSLVDQIRQNIADSNIAADKATMGNLLEHMMRNGLDTANFPTRELQEMLAEGMDIPDEKWQEIVADINEKLANAGLEPIELDVKTGNITKVAKEVGASWQDAAHAVQAVGSALQSIEDPTAKILGIIGQAIANVALGFAKATTAESGKGIWAWIAAIAGGVGTMVSTISAIHSATGYSEGGMIKGTTYSNDQIMANGGTIGLNAGEIVLNRAQAGNLASALTDPRAGADRRPYLDVETIWLGMGHYLKRRGMGEIVTSK